jgi:hypothetical protein
VGVIRMEKLGIGVTLFKLRGFFDSLAIHINNLKAESIKVTGLQ